MKRILGLAPRTNVRRYTVPWVPSLALHPDGEIGKTLLAATSAVVNTVYQICSDGRMVSFDELAKRVSVNDNPDLLRAVIGLATEMGLLVSTEIDIGRPRGNA